MSIDILLLGISLASGASTAAGFGLSSTPTSPTTKPQHFLLGESTKQPQRKRTSRSTSLFAFSPPPETTDDLFPYSGSIRPGIQSPQRIVSTKELPSSRFPSYANDGIPKENRPFLSWMIEQKTPPEIEKMRSAGKLAREVLDLAGRSVDVGVTTDEIDAIVHEAILKAGAYPSTLNYHKYPKSLCTSVNEVICHGIPDDRKLEKGDIINLDVTVYLDGYHGDCSEMFVVGGEESDNLDESTKQLLQTTYDAWLLACNCVRPGQNYQEIGTIIEDYVQPKGYQSVPRICGHGIGRIFHDNPEVHHTRNFHHNGEMAVGHTFTIEPMICEGTSKFIEWPDDWTITTADGKRSAQFEHTLLVTDDGGVEALTGKNEQSMIHFWEKESNIHPSGIWLGTSQAAKQKAEAINSKLLLV